ncbi:MAG: hypothetical protein R3C28_18945 [Pirellulaceae bacterium]
MAKNEYAKKRGILERLPEPWRKNLLFIVLFPLVGTIVILVEFADPIDELSVPRWVPIMCGAVFAMGGLLAFGRSLVETFKHSVLARMLYDIVVLCIFALFTAITAGTLLYGTHIETQWFIPPEFARWVMLFTIVPCMTVLLALMIAGTAVRWYRWFRYKEWDSEGDAPNTS